MQRVNYRGVWVVASGILFVAGFAVGFAHLATIGVVLIVIASLSFAVFGVLHLIPSLLTQIRGGAVPHAHPAKRPRPRIRMIYGITALAIAVASQVVSRGLQSTDTKDLVLGIAVALIVLLVLAMSWHIRRLR